MVLQAMTNVVLGMSRWVERRSWGEGLPEEENEEEHEEGERKGEVVEELWRRDVGMRVGEFMQVRRNPFLYSLSLEVQGEETTAGFDKGGFLRRRLSELTHLVLPPSPLSSSFFAHSPPSPPL